MHILLYKDRHTYLTHMNEIPTHIVPLWTTKKLHISWNCYLLLSHPSVIFFDHHHP